MVTKTLEVALGTTMNPITYATGWYQDPVTGEYLYYDASTGQWFVYAAGYIYPLTITEIYAPKVVTVKAGDSLKISISYMYTGPESVGVEEYFSIGRKDLLGYHPKVVGKNTRTLPITPTPTKFTSERTLVIPTDVGLDWTYIECKVWHGTPDVPETGIRLKDALEVVGVEPDIAEFTIVDYVVV